MKNIPILGIVAAVVILVLGAAVQPGLRIKQYPNDGNPPDDAGYIMEETTGNKHILHSQLRFRMTNGLATTSFVAQASSSNITVAAGANTSVSTNVSGGKTTYTVGTSLASAFDNIIVTNAFNRIRSLVPSTTTTQQIDVATGPTAYYWTNMVTNVVCQLTNVWTASVSNRVLDFFFTGATNGGPNYTVTFNCPNPAGVIFRWGIFSATNGATSFTVTNNVRVGASLTIWDTNLVEAYFSPVR